MLYLPMEKEVQVFLILLVGAAIVISSLGQETGYATRKSGNYLQPTIHTNVYDSSRRGNEHWVVGVVKGEDGPKDQGNIDCYMYKGLIECRDMYGHVYDYRCGWSFRAYGADADLHLVEPLKCDAHEVHCPNAQKNTENSVKLACGAIKNCPFPVTDDVWEEHLCRMTPGKPDISSTLSLYTECKTTVFARCEATKKKGKK